jgi:hypothetical protein
MHKFSLLNIFFASFVFLFSQCAVIELTEVSSISVPPKFKKILFVEQVSDSRTYDFYNKFRQSLKRECAAKGYEAEFVRITETMELPQEKLTKLKVSFKPDMLFNLETEKAKAYRWGPLNNSVSQIKILCTLMTFPDEKTVWSGNLSIEQTWGVDVSTEKAAKKLLTRLIVEN